ncbi:hypothetical protein [Spirosoma foliorum]|nr:hypothetical protein [Spirosoma foliorum]
MKLILKASVKKAVTGEAPYKRNTQTPLLLLVQTREILMLKNGD